MNARSQPDLFAMQMTAVIAGPGDCYRYELRRVWDEGKPLLVVCMLNPSTADHTVNDPTVLVLIHFAKLWGYGGLLVVNLWAWRASRPQDIPGNVDQTGPDNPSHWQAALRYASRNGARALAAWGSGSALNPHAVSAKARAFCREAEIWGVELVCLGTTENGSPKHPMARGKHRIPRDQQPIAWKATT